MQVRFYERFIAAGEADAIFARLLGEIAWAQKPIVIFGKQIMQPRLTAWYGDPAATYRYSGIVNTPIVWTPLLLELKGRVEAVAEQRFNSALLNLYRDGRDSMGLHADDEKELGVNPVIASLSFGATRRFVLIPNKKHKARLPKVEMEMTHGSLLVMDGDTQHVYKHGVPKQPAITDPRINLTFRWVNA